MQRTSSRWKWSGNWQGEWPHDFNNILTMLMLHLGIFQTKPQLEPATRTGLMERESDAMWRGSWDFEVRSASEWEGDDGLGYGAPKLDPSLFFRKMDPSDPSLFFPVQTGPFSANDVTSWNFYSYWQAMGGSPPRGQTWGNCFESGVPLRTVAKEQWICLEIMAKLNDVGDSNGEQAYWLDGKLSRNAEGQITSYLGKGFPSVGTWIYDKFEPYVSQRGIAWDYRQGKGVSIEGGKPFPGFAWRSVPELKINALWLYRYMSQPEKGTSQVWWDHVVVAKKYIGPLTPIRR